MSETMAKDSFPDPTPTVPRKPLSSFKLMSFDIYGTLINWEKGITDRLSLLAKRLPESSPKHDANALGSIFTKHEADLEHRFPKKLYHKLLAQAYLATAEEIGISTEGLEKEAEEFGNSVGTWPAFPDTIEAMQRLGKHFKLVALSNTDQLLFNGTKTQALKGEVDFDGEYLADAIGAYKPSLENFHYLLENAEKDFEVSQEQVLVVANSLRHDHVPAKELGLSSVWVDRGGVMGGDKEQLCRDGEVGYGWRVRTLKELADLVEEEAKKGTL